MQRDYYRNIANQLREYVNIVKPNQRIPCVGEAILVEDQVWVCKEVVTVLFGLLDCLMF